MNKPKIPIGLKFQVTKKAETSQGLTALPFCENSQGCKITFLSYHTLKSPQLFQPSALELSLIQPMAGLQELHKDPHDSKHTSPRAKQREIGPGGRKYNSDGSLCPAETGRAQLRGRWTGNGPGPGDMATWGLSPPDPKNRKLTDPATKCGGLKGQQESWVPRIMVAKKWPKDSGDFIHNRAVRRRPF